MEREVRKIYNELISRKYGARESAKMGVYGVYLQAQKSKANGMKEFLKEIKETANLLLNARAYEPMLYNSLNLLLTSLPKDVSKAKKLISKRYTHYLNKLKKSEERIGFYGAQIISNNANVLTHCYSSSVVGIIKKAKKKGVRVVCTETRPDFLGRRTEMELREAGIPTTIIIDSAVGFFIKSVDLVLVGGEGVLSSGSLVNRIGSSVIACVAYEYGVPFYSAIELLKFDPTGNVEKLCSSNEKNPRYDITPAKYITGYITEMGVIPPSKLSTISSSKLFAKPFLH